VETLVGGTLVAGFVTFLIGAAAWRMAYEQPMQESLRVVHEDRRRRAWIHLWMVPAMFVTSAGLAGVVVVVEDPVAAVLAAMTTVVFALGAVCWVVSLVFRLTVVPWAAERTVTDGAVPDAYLPLDRWASGLYATHMLSAYAAAAILGAAVLADGALPGWLGSAGVAFGLGWAAGFVATRAAGPFNPPIWAHLYTGVVGVVLLTR
jgi:hypothetical protein